jgi:Metallo-beta-lactamase superfamily
MQLTIFESSAGDCLLLEANTGELVLCDGGMRASMTAQVRDELAALRDAGRALDLVYVSHIDNDHISGVLQLLEDEAEWRVFDFHEASGDPVRQPRVPRPPEIKGILHNSFSDLIGENNAAISSLAARTALVREIEALLIASAPTCYASAIPVLVHAADEMQGIAAGIPEALTVSRLIAADALDIPLNKPPGVRKAGALLRAGRAGETFTLGSMKFQLIGPTKAELEALGLGWNTWLRENKDRVRQLRAQLKRRIDDMSNGTLTTSPYDLRDWNGIPDLKGVTAPNVASLMFLVTEGSTRILLTGDGQQDVILRNLERIGVLDADENAGVHFDVLKVQHHGSEHNMDPEFARRVSADHYVFCGNGSHGNPELSVIDMIYDSRVGAPSVRAVASKADGRDFHFWFSTTAAAAPAGTERAETYAQMEEHVEQLRQSSGGRMHVHFNEGASIVLTP